MGALGPGFWYKIAWEKMLQFCCKETLKLVMLPLGTGSKQLKAKGWGLVSYHLPSDSLSCCTKSSSAVLELTDNIHCAFNH